MADLMDEVIGNNANVQIPANFSGETAENDQEVEQRFAIVCIKYAETHWSLLENLSWKTRSFTSQDDAILAAFTEHFPEIAANPSIVTEEQLKSPAAKALWRKIAPQFETSVDNYNFGTLIRSNCREDYSETNSIFALRIQFLAIEIARNRLGLNDFVHEQYQEAKRANVAAALA